MTVPVYSREIIDEFLAWTKPEKLTLFSLSDYSEWFHFKPITA